MPKKGKGHSKKKRHFIGVPAGGVGTTKERKMARKGRAAKAVLQPCVVCEKPLKWIKMVTSTGKVGHILYCSCST